MSFFAEFNMLHLFHPLYIWNIVVCGFFYTDHGAVVAECGVAAAQVRVHGASSHGDDVIAAGFTLT